MIDLKELARMGAVARLKALDDERIHLMAFLGDATPKARKTLNVVTVKGRSWSKAQHAKFAATMKKKGRK